ncbi:MAG: ADOP family duplicated permease [Gemmatimonadota bacterium]
MSETLHDLRIAVRSLLHRQSLALGVVLTMGLGIGATTTIFGIVDGVVLKPLPYDDPGQLVVVGEGAESVDPETGLQSLNASSTLNLQALRERARSYALLGALQALDEFVVSEEGAAFEQRVPAARFSEEVFQILGLSPALGRTFVPEEYAPAGPTTGPGASVAMISYGYWQARYGGDPDVIGRPLETGAVADARASSIIVGVIERGFVAPESFFPSGSEPDVILPFPPGSVVREGGMVRVTAQSAFGIGRLRPGTTVAAARIEAERLSPEVAAAAPFRIQGASTPTIGVNGLHDQTVGGAARSLWIFLGAAGLLLLLSILNAATLLLARTMDRGQELGVRTALGAGKGRIVRLLIGEAGLLTFVGAVIGIVLAYGGIEAFLRFAPPDVPRLGTIAVSLRVLGAAVGISVAAGLLMGLLPALRVTARAPWERLQRGARSIAESRSRLRTGLIGGQLGLAMVLLSGAALLFGSFMRVRNADPGFVTEELFTTSGSVGPIQITRTGQASRTTIWEQWDPVLDRISALPGVESVVAASNLPFQAPSWAPRVFLPDDDPETIREGITGYAVTSGFFGAMGTEVRRGRGIEAQDGPDDELVVVVNEAFVRTQLGGRDPLDMVLRRETTGLGTTGEIVAMRVIGVVEDVVQGRAADGVRPAIYIPYRQADMTQLIAWNIALRSTRSLESLRPELDAALAGVSAQPGRDLATMSDRIAATHVTPRFQAMLIGGFAFVAVFLAAMGLYGSLAQSVRWRQKEIGIRMALGADRESVLSLVLKDGLRLALAGLAVGMAVTLASSRVLASQLYEIEPTDPVTLLGVAIVLTLVSVAACLAPARRATSVDPVRVLKSE